jgi:predicted Zn-dependent protease
MTEKSSKRQALERSLADDPTDAFLRYGLAIQCLREGDFDEGRRRLRELLHDHPDDQVAAYQQLGQSYLETEEFDEARFWLASGIAKAKQRGDWHAQAEMEGLLNQID